MPCLVYCFEAADNGGAVKNLILPVETEFTPEYRSNLLGGITVLSATATAVFQTSANKVISVPFKAAAIPYYANANRGTCEMRVWMPEGRDGCSPQKQE